MSEVQGKVERPLSPHLGIYKPQISSVLSITHRLTGVFLSGGSLLLALWLFSAAYEQNLYRSLNDLCTSIVGGIFLIAWTAAYYYHLCNGIRHLFWDMGKGFTIPAMTKSGLAVIAGTALLTAITWICVWEII